MNGIGHAGFALTPRNRFRTTQDALQTRENDNGWQLSLKSVIGTTTGSNNAFDSLPEHNLFAYCAGPAVIVSSVDESLNVSQRLFRARHSTSPINGSSSFYNPNTPPTTPTRSRHGSPLKEGSSEEYGSAYPGGGKACIWNREATCISLSRGGRFLAVGETGYNPRVLLFSTALDSPTDVPLSVLMDHSFGVQSIAFSHDTRWLCSLGNSFDGFLLLYTVNPKTGLIRLHSSNKCSNVSNVAWMGNSVITVGARHVKVWRVERKEITSPSKGPLDLASSNATAPGSPGPKTFFGRNCLLGSLLDATFTCIATISTTRAILCTSQGDVCLLDDSDKSQKLERVAKMDFSIQCAYYDEGRGLVWMGGTNQRAKAVSLEALTVSRAPSNLTELSGPADIIPDSSKTPSDRPKVLAVGSVRDRVVSSDSERNVRITQVERDQDVYCLGSLNKHLPAHESAVLGVCELLYRTNANTADFLTYSARGTVLFWLLDGTCISRIDIRLDQVQYADDGDSNELKVVVASSLDECLFSGDKRGVLRITDRTGRSNVAIQAHNGDINGIAVAKSDNDVLVASCGRDRIVQLYRRVSDDLELIQTLDDHAATIGDVLFTGDGTILLSISSDRTVLIRKIARVEREALAFLPVRVITLKATPTSFGLVPSEADNIVVSTMDRQVQKYDMRSGRLVSSFKAQDPSNGETVLVNSLEIQKVTDGTEEKNVLFGASSADRAIRMHDCNSGVLLSREQGQTAVSAVKVISRDEDGKPASRLLISCGLDGTVSIWDVCKPRQGQDSPSRSESPLKQTPASTQPARKTLSQAEIKKFQKSLESEEDGISPIRSPSPSRIRRKTSRYSMADKRRSSLAPLTTGNNTTPTPATRKTSPDPHPSSPLLVVDNKPLKTLRSHRPSLDHHRRRSKSAANLNDLNDSAEQIITSVQAFRERVAAAVSDKLQPNTVASLESELNLALIALRERTSRGGASNGWGAAESLDVYLAKMIDARLALRDKSDAVAEVKAPAQLAGASEAGTVVPALSINVNDDNAATEREA